VTQRPETRGLLWPSKLALLERLPRSILWVGPTDGDIARRLVARGGAGVFAPGDATGVAAWVEHVYLHPAAPDPPLTGEPGVEEGCATWEKWFREIARDL
jgi:colanic acid biosynthesis glycosyl transferase WcaI